LKVKITYLSSLCLSSHFSHGALWRTQC